ncbi:protein kinase [Nocardioides sp. MAH-18]|uniref:non-specific serine/threonine protein kinase n=1 Tax=Nocardioides agri TaxID=2682843 RepID=A0A6L6XRF8_9ACTN|nr:MULTISPECIES: serine/threonine-protein kinase [unclassified Nocardioides]MBA2955035.1 serine/threonine protein kinase [Nocardioides sp. CGMCC 1.13656]MVQ49889.1 protein kinase [Nocardioides sp. MAH-18]
MTSPAPPLPLAGRYQLLDRIGSGAMGSVWRATDLRTGETVAAKVLGAHDSAMLLRFVREQSLRIRHPHVLAPTGWAADDHRVVLGMDLVRGGSLDDLLAETGPLPTSYAVLLLDQLLQALAAVHAAGVVHRDVKPANLLLEPTGDGAPFLRLGDFGVAVPVEDVRLTRGPAAIGTDGYMAPEQVGGAAPDPRQDVYAAGVVAVQLLTGRPPRVGHPSLVPEGPLRPLLGAMTHSDPAVRTPSAAAALERLRRLDVPGDGPWPWVPDRLGEPTPARGRDRAAVALVAALVVVVVALAAYLLATAH